MVDDSPAKPAPVPSKARSVLRLWALALAASAALAASGERWPEPLAVQPALVALWLLSQWRNGGEGESLH